MAPEERTRKDPDGFIPLEALKARARTSSCGEFARSCPGPALVVVEDVNAPYLPGPQKAGGSGFLIVTIEGASKECGAAQRYWGRVAFLAKRPGNPFPNMISIGRSTSNDVVVALETISKLHGYFLREGDVWFYTDYQSTNGTLINDKRVEKGEKRLLGDGDRFQLGLDVRALFLSPESLYARVRGGKA